VALRHRSPLDSILSSRVTGSALGAAERLARWPAGRLTVLTYHRIDDVRPDGRDPSLISATPAEFEHHVSFLQEHCELVSISDVAKARAGITALPERAVLLTFDDGVDDFRSAALPILRRHGAAAVVFVPTGFVDDPAAWFWWDAVYAAIVTTDRKVVDSLVGPLTLGSSEDRAIKVRHLRAELKERPWRELLDHVRRLCDDLDVEPPPANVMSWATLRDLARQGIDVCPHTRTHPHLDQVPLDVACHEISGSIDDVQAQLGIVPQGFAYPSGRWSAPVANLVAECGVPLAFTTQRGSHRIMFEDPLLIRRINVSRRTGFHAARAFMHPWADSITDRHHEAARGSTPERRVMWR